MGRYYIRGMVHARITSADIPELIRILARKRFPLKDTVPGDGLDITLWIPREKLNEVSKLCESRGDSFEIIGRSGLYWTGIDLIKRPVLLLGTLLLLIFLLWIPSRVLFVRVEGARMIPERRILQAAESCGIHFGASRRRIRSESMKNTLLEALPELRWAGVNTYGCVAVISVREKEQAHERQSTDGISSIVADCDGVILSATATSGNLLCQPGQVVTMGQILISGYRDDGTVIHATRSEGEIMARTIRQISAISPATCHAIRSERVELVEYSLIIGKNRIILWKDSGNAGVTCGRMYEEYYITLPGGFRLPVALGKDTMVSYETEITVMEDAPEMVAYAGDYLLTQLVAGTLNGYSEDILTDGTTFRMECVFFCTEMIGRQKAEEIGELHG